MGGATHIFPAPQADYLRAIKGGRHQPGVLSCTFRPRFSLVESMPPVYQQSLQGACVANAVTALLEYYGDCKTRLSVQYLHAATKEIERAGLERNLAALRAGERLDAPFEAVCHAELMQLRMIADANGGMSAAATMPYLARFESGMRARFESASGCLLKSCFMAVETRGICRYAVWPSAGARATSPFGGAAYCDFPPMSHEDAAKRRVTSGLYLLGTPNNVDEIRGIISGANERRPMPVAVTVDFFAGCDGETYSFPEVVETDAGELASKNEWLGRHGLLLVGYEDDPKALGGGYFIIRNSLGEDWGDKGYGRMPYAYLECFALEAGTILQSMVDYAGDGYGGQRVAEKAPKKRRWSAIMLNLLIAAAIVAGTVAVGVYFDDPLGLRHEKSAPPQPSAVPSPQPESAERPASAPEAPPVRPVAAEPGGGAPQRPLEPPPLRAIPQDGKEAVPCVVRISAKVKGETLPMIEKMLPDVKMACTADEKGVTCRLVISRKRFLMCARAVQKRFDGEVYLSGRNTCMEIVEKNESPDFWMSD